MFEHGVRKQQCEDEHDNCLENLPVEDPVSRFLSDNDQSVFTPGKGKKRKSQGKVVHPQPSDDLDISQVGTSCSSSSSLVHQAFLKNNRYYFDMFGAY